MVAFKSFITYIANRAYTSSSAIDVDDLIQVGMIAADCAIKDFDPSCGSNYVSFVRSRIKDAVYLEASIHCGVFMVPSYVLDLAVKVHRLASKGHSDAKIVDLLSNSKRNIDIAWVRDLRFLYSRRAVAPQEAALNKTSDDTTTDTDQVLEFLDRIDLTELERKIIHFQFLRGMSSQDTADKLGLSQGYVSKVKNQLEKKIRGVVNE